MRLRDFMIMIAAIIKRIVLVRCESHRQLFIDLAPVLISAQNRGLPFGPKKLLAPYRTLVSHHVRALAKGQEALSGSSGGFLRLPLGCRFGKLHFSPLLQLAKLVKTDSVATVDFEILPRTPNEIGLNIRRRIGLGHHAGEPAAFKTILGFSLRDYCAFLTTLRRSHPVLFVMLMANEFRYARDWASAHATDTLLWVERAAALGELERLVEIVSFAKDHRLSIGQLKKALKGLARRQAANTRAALSRTNPELLRHVEQLAYGTEALRALFLGDGAGPPLAPETSWSSTTPGLRWKAAARSAWFAKNEAVEIPGFRSPKRFIRGQRGCAYTYYGVPLDCLLVVGLKDLATALGLPGGVHAVDALAAEIHSGLFGPMPDFDRLARQASIYSEIYLREQGHGGSGNRFDPRCWFENGCDEALYGRLWRLFIGPINAMSTKSVRYQIRSSILVLRQLLDNLWQRPMAVNPAEANRAVAQLACALTPVSMDPIFAALLDRALMERGVTANFRIDPSRMAAKQGNSRIEEYLKRFLSRVLRPAYARFQAVDDRVNYNPRAIPAEPLVRSKTLPRALRRAAT